MPNTHETYMKAALKQARLAERLGEVPIGCVIVYAGSPHEKPENRRQSEEIAKSKHKTPLVPGQIIATAYNRRNTDKSALAHAEISAIRKASKIIGDWRLDNCVMYVTLEPCQMCAGAIVQARIPTVVIGCMNEKAGCAGSILNILEMPQFNHQANVIRGVLETDCAGVLSGFFQNLRSTLSPSNNTVTPQGTNAGPPESNDAPRMGSLMRRTLALILALTLTACAVTPQGTNVGPPVPVADPAAPPHEIIIPTASALGTAIEENDKAIIDYSNAADGYVMVKYHEATANKLNVLIDGPQGEQYVYGLEPATWAVFTLTEGSGPYTVTLCEQVDGTKFKVVLTAHVEAQITDPLSPFLRPNHHVDYNENSAVVKKAASLAAGMTGFIDIISVVYNFVTSNLEYDEELAQTVESGYLPDIDQVLASGKGICFDYAAVMAAMLRSLGIPTRMVFGYTGEYYHAWVSVYSEEEGWIDNIIHFDGHVWRLMDPTFAAGANGNSEVLSYIGEGQNYLARFQY